MKEISLEKYKGDIPAIIDATANINGVPAERLAWYTDGLYAGDINLILNEIPVGQIRHNRACGELP